MWRARLLSRRRTKLCGVSRQCGGLSSRSGPQANELQRRHGDFGSLVDVGAYTKLVSGLAREQKWQLAIAALEHCQRRRSMDPDVVLWGAVVNACAKAGAWEAAIALVQAAEGAGLPASIVAHGAAISACGRAQQWQAAVALLDGLDKFGLRPNRVVCNATLSACEKGAKWAEALGLFASLPARKLTPDTITCNALLSACGEASQWALAMHLLRTTETKLNVISFNAALHALAKDNQWRLTLQLLAEMESLGVRPNVVSYSTAITACTRAEEFDHALALFEDMKSKGIEPNEVTHTAVMRARARCMASPVSVDELLAELSGERQRGRELGAVAYGAAINACQEAGQWEAAISILEVMRKDMVPPNVVCYGAAAAACEVAGEWRAALQLLEDMERGAVQASPPACCSVMSACSKAGEYGQVLSLLDQMRSGDRGLPQPNAIVYGVALNACYRAERWEEALSVLQAAEADGVELSIDSHNFAISTCARAGQHEVALALVQAMEVSKSPPPNTQSYSFLTRRLPHLENLQCVRELKESAFFSLDEDRGPSPGVVGSASATSTWAPSASLSSNSRGLAPRPFMGIDPWKTSLLMRAGCKSHQQHIARPASSAPAPPPPPPPPRSATTTSAPHAQATPTPAATPAATTPAAAPAPPPPTLQRAPEAPPSVRRDAAPSADQAATVAPAFSDATSSSSAPPPPGPPTPPASVAGAAVGAPPEAEAQPMSTGGSSKEAETSSEDDDEDYFEEDHEVEENAAIKAPANRLESFESAEVQEGLSYRVLRTGNFIIDLHGLPVEVAKVAVQVALEDLIIRPPSWLRPDSPGGDLIIVTGIGRHSAGGIALIKPAVRQFLREDLRLKTVERPREPGRIRVPAAELWTMRGVPDPNA
eukprot:TRINITY_DN63341_c0_g1_i1.p1 TRINITY_DN63341_c0_g1~~TRINITY_DN63341_c0_g1_i1.p1  ORF type:complete len:884 (+),score=152.69 TRINITY_DN63341_c0_g1_i1:89-2740(+)